MKPFGEAKLEAADIEQREFDTGFRGYDQTSVREYLRKLAAVVRSEQLHADDTSSLVGELELQIEELNRELADARAEVEPAGAVAAPATGHTVELADMDEDQLTQLLGLETARVLTSARQAGNDLVARAEAKAAAIDEAADNAKAAAEAEVTAYREEAAQKAAAEREAAEAEALETVQKASAEANDIREKADQLLASTTEEAHQKATQIVSSAQEEADELRRTATHDAELAKAAAEELRENSEQGAAAIRAEAEADAQAAQDAAREHARLMLVEAQSVREKVLSDLVQRRRVARQQLDGAKAARDRLARSMAIVRQQLDESATELQLSVPEARVAMETIARRENAAEDEQDVANLARELDAGSPDRATAVAKRRPASQPAATPAPMPAVEVVAAADTATDLVDSGDTDVDSDDLSETSGAETQDLDDIFARIRSTTGASEAADAAEDAETGNAVTDDAATDDAATDDAATDDAATDDAATDGAPSSKKAKPKRQRRGAAVVIPVTDDVDADETAENQADSGDHDATEADEEPAEPDAPSVFIDRDVALTRLGPDVRRHIKRTFADDQSDVLDRLRSGLGAPTIDELAPKQKLVMMVIDALTPGCVKAAERGANAFGVGGGADVSSLVETMATELVDPFRSRLEAIIDRGENDRDEILEPVRSLYRDIRGSKLTAVADDSLAAAFALGLYESIADGEQIRWENDPRAGHGAECHDNLLAGAIAKGESFPTGHQHPLVEPGCRCLVVPNSYVA